PRRALAASAAHAAQSGVRLEMPLSGKILFPGGRPPAPLESRLGDNGASFGTVLRFVSARNGFLRRVIAFGPHSAIRGELFFPDRHGALQRVDRVAAGVERGGAVRRAHGDQHARLANVEPPQSVNDGHAAHGKPRMDCRRDLSHFGDSHGFVSLVLQIQRTPPFEIVTDKTVKDCERAAAWRSHGLGDFFDANRFARQPEDVALGCSRLLSTAYRGQKGYFIAARERRAPAGVLLVDGYGGRPAEGRQRRKLPAVTFEEV